jgi:hypothetical protein
MVQTLSKQIRKGFKSRLSCFDRQIDKSVMEAVLQPGVADTV